MHPINSTDTSVLERLLLRFCREVQPEKLQGADNPAAFEQEMRTLAADLPELTSIVQGKRVLDFGCGTGSHAVGMALNGASSVVGLDINDRFLEVGRAKAKRHGVSDKVEFKKLLGQHEIGSFEVVLSYNSMEHFSDPQQMLALMRSAVSTSGRVVISFSPPWYSAYGAHFHYITPIPWVHLLFPERLLMKVRTRYKSDGAERFEDIEGGLNKMSVSKFKRLLEREGLSPEWMRLTAMKRIPLVTKIPVIRELTTVQVACSLAAG